MHDETTQQTPTSSLVKQIKACQHCHPELPLPPKPIFALNSHARILIAGQAPGLKAHQTGIPFDDASGDRLRQWLGVSRRQFYDDSLFAILPMGFCYPGKGVSGDRPPRPECANLWRSKALAELTQLSLTLVIGKYAQTYHIEDNKCSLTQSIQQQNLNGSTLVLPHPSGRNNRWFKKNNWFEEVVLPHLKQRVELILATADS